MTAREYMVYEWSCDRCDDTEVDEVDGIPDGWETLDEGDFCQACASSLSSEERSQNVEKAALRKQLRKDAEASAKRPAHEKRHMPAIIPPALRCDTCSGTGLVDWAPFQQRDSEDDQQPCPDCSRIPPVKDM